MPSPNDIMTGYYRETNKVALSKVERLLRGDLNAPDVESVNSPENKEMIMAKKQAGEQTQFEGLEDDTPQELIDLALLLKKEQKAEAKAKANTKATIGALLQKMHELDLIRFRINVEGNFKWVTRHDVESIKFEKSETAPVESE